MARTPLKERVLAFIDTETTGLDPYTHEVIDVAIIRETSDGRLLDEWSTKLKPTHIEVADPYALKVNGYEEHAKLWENAPTFSEVADEIVRSLDDCIVVGHNVSFDLDFLQESLKRVGNTARLPYHKVDTVTLAYEHLVPKGLASLSLDAIRDFLGWSRDGAHTALVDALDARRLFTKLARPDSEDEDYDWKTGDADAQ